MFNNQYLTVFENDYLLFAEIPKYPDITINH
jgi:hypothetical protein